MGDDLLVLLPTPALDSALLSNTGLAAGTAVCAVFGTAALGKAAPDTAHGCFPVYTAAHSLGLRHCWIAHTLGSDPEQGGSGAMRVAVHPTQGNHLSRLLGRRHWLSAQTHCSVMILCQWMALQTAGLGQTVGLRDFPVLKSPVPRALKRRVPAAE